MTTLYRITLFANADSAEAIEDDLGTTLGYSQLEVGVDRIEVEGSEAKAPATTNLPRLQGELTELGEATLALREAIAKWDAVRDIGWTVADGQMRHTHIDVRLDLSKAHQRVEKAQAAVAASAVEEVLVTRDIQQWTEQEESDRTSNEHLTP